MVGDSEFYKARFGRFKNSPFREYQEQAIAKIVGCRKKFCVVEAPTGMGKSIIGMVAGAMTGDTTYLVHSRALQVQLHEDFYEVPILWGRQNYKCVREGIPASFTAGMCTHRKSDKCISLSECPYRTAKVIAGSSGIRILNYDYFITEANRVGQFSAEETKGKNDLVIVDEADALEGLLSGYINIEISEAMINRYGIERPKWKTTKAKDGLAEWKAWGVKMRERVKRLVDLMGDNVEKMKAGFGSGGWGGVLRSTSTSTSTSMPMFTSTPTSTPTGTPSNISKTSNISKKPSSKFVDDGVGKEIAKAIRNYERMQGLLRNIELFNETVDETWLYDDAGGGIRFRPTWITEELADEVMWRHGAKFALMSATFHRPHILSKLIGAKLGDIQFNTFPSTFPEKSRRVVMNPVANLVYADMDAEIPKLLDGIREVMARHRDEKGVIHCVSYRLRDEIMGIGDYRLVTHGAADKLAVVDRFKKSEMPLVLVSPSSERGISLNDDMCRFIIWAKAPYMSLADKLVNARLYSGGRGGVGQEWYVSQMLLSVVQGCGRGTRSKDDHCVSYLLDQQIVNAIVANPGLVPSWWNEAAW